MSYLRYGPNQVGKLSESGGDTALQSTVLAHAGQDAYTLELDFKEGQRP